MKKVTIGDYVRGPAGKGYVTSYTVFAGAVNVRYEATDFAGICCVERLIKLRDPKLEPLTPTLARGLTPPSDADECERIGKWLVRRAKWLRSKETNA